MSRLLEEYNKQIKQDLKSNASFFVEKRIDSETGLFFIKLIILK